MNHDSITDEKYMREALELARRGLRAVDPNPMVGCILVRDEKVVGRGYHAKFGGPHAEVGALKEAGDAAIGATAYVSLEPCANDYPGKKTGPCAPALIAAGVTRVVVAVSDPNPNVMGLGVQLLREAGIDVETDVLHDAGAYQIRGFLHWMTSGRPYVILKEAQTADGFVAANLSANGWFTSPQARAWVHHLRAEVGGILIGRRTAEADNPSLTVRDVAGMNPTRIVLDTQRQLSYDLALFSDQMAPTWQITSGVTGGEELWGERIVVPMLEGRLDLGALLDELGSRQIISLLVEGGPEVHRSFLTLGLAQEMVIIRSVQEADADVRKQDRLRGALSVPDSWTILETINDLPESIVIAQTALN